MLTCIEVGQCVRRDDASDDMDTRVTCVQARERVRVGRDASCMQIVKLAVVVSRADDNRLNLKPLYSTQEPTMATLAIAPRQTSTSPSPSSSRPCTGQPGSRCPMQACETDWTQ